MSVFVVKKGVQYVAFPSKHAYMPDARGDEWTDKQMFAWRWVGLESGNGARLAARAIGDGARVVKLVAKVRIPPPIAILNETKGKDPKGDNWDGDCG